MKDEKRERKRRRGRNDNKNDGGGSGVGVEKRGGGEVTSGRKGKNENWNIKNWGGKKY